MQDAASAYLVQNAKDIANWSARATAQREHPSAHTATYKDAIRYIDEKVNALTAHGDAMRARINARAV